MKLSYRKSMLTVMSVVAIAITSGCRSSKQAGTNVLPVRVAFTNIPLSYLPIFLADSLGFYKEQGLSVTIDNSSNGAKTMEALLGHSVDVYPGGVVFATGAWLRDNPEAARRTGHAIQAALAWIVNHTPEQIWEAIPKSYRADRDLDLLMLRGVMPSFSHDGVMPRDGADAVTKAMSITSEKVRLAKFDLANTYTNEFLPKP